MRTTHLIAFLLLLIGVVAFGQSKPEGWWDLRWNRRCSLVFEEKGAVLKDLPVLVQGRQLKQILGDEKLAVASLRVVGPKGEISSQFDEFDGGSTIATNPNHELDDNDELVFQVDIPSGRDVQYWIYWNTDPLPSGRYKSLMLMGDAMEPAAYQHDIQLWNDQCRIGMKGPARGKNPTKNEIDNWGAGVITLFDVYRLPVLNINASWSSVFPHGCYASSPSADATRWEQPRELVRGPVRVGAFTRFIGAELKTPNGPSVKGDIEHRVWLYERRAYVCFEEIVTLRESVQSLPLFYDHAFFLGGDVGDQFWYSNKGQLQSFAPTTEQLSEGKKGTIIFNTSGFDPWMAGYSGALKKGFAVFFDSGKMREGEERNASCYARTGPTLRYSRTLKNLPAAVPITQRFWVMGMKSEPNGLIPFHTWQALTMPSAMLGQVEKRGAR